MKFCTTCGRTYDDMSVDMCPHDGTPLFSMAGEEPEPEAQELGSRAAAGAFESAVLDDHDREEMEGALAEVSEFAREEMRLEADDMLGLSQDSDGQDDSPSLQDDESVQEDPYADLPAPVATARESYDDLPVALPAASDSDDHFSLADSSSEELAMPSEPQEPVQEDPYADLPAPVAARESYDDLPVALPAASDSGDHFSLADSSSEDLVLPPEQEADLVEEPFPPSSKEHPGFELSEADEAASLKIEHAIDDVLDDHDQEEPEAAPLAFTPDAPMDTTFTDEAPAPPPKKKQGNSGTLVFLLLLTLAAVAGWYFFLGPGSDVGDAEVPQDTPPSQDQPQAIPPTDAPNNLDTDSPPAPALSPTLSGMAPPGSGQLAKTPEGTPATGEPVGQEKVQPAQQKPPKKAAAPRKPAPKKSAAKAPEPAPELAAQPAAKEPVKPVEEALIKELDNLMEE